MDILSCLTHVKTVGLRFRRHVACTYIVLAFTLAASSASSHHVLTESSMRWRACHNARHVSPSSVSGKHLLSGACPEPEKLRNLKDDGTKSTHPDVVQLHQLRQDIAGLARHQLGALARRDAAGLLTHRCLVCNFWTPDHTKVKSHFRQAHPQDWRRLLTPAGQEPSLPFLHIRSLRSGSATGLRRTPLHRRSPSPRLRQTPSEQILCSSVMWHSLSTQWHSHNSTPNGEATS